MGESSMLDVLEALASLSSKLGTAGFSGTFEILLPWDDFTKVSKYFFLSAQPANPIRLAAPCGYIYIKSIPSECGHSGIKLYDDPDGRGTSGSKEG